MFDPGGLPVGGRNVSGTGISISLRCPLVPEAVFPHVAEKRGHYESFYLRACHPSELLGIWIRHTVHKRPGAAPHGSVWFTLWDPLPHAAKVTVDDLSVPRDGWIRVADSVFEPGRAVGSALGASWDLGFEPEAPPFRHLPAEWMYRAPIPRTKTESPAPAARFSGTVTVDGRSVAVDAWPGMVGHNWGAEHAERWIWMHGIAFDGDGAGDWIDAAIGRVKLGPLTTPWIGNGCLSVGGRSYRLGGKARSVRESPERCEFALGGKGVSVTGELSAPHDRLGGWGYAGPGGGEDNTPKFSIAGERPRRGRGG